MLERVVNALSLAADEVVVVRAGGQRLPAALGGVTVVEDIHVGRGPLGGLHAGLSTIESGCAIVVGCDMPFLDPGLLAGLAPMAGECDAVVPRVGGRLQTLHAVYGRTCLGAVATLLERGRPGLHDLLGLVRVRYMEDGDLAETGRWRRSCMSVNTPADLERAESLLSLPGT